MVNEKSEARPGAARYPFQHCKITIGIAKGGNGAAANELIDRDRLGFVVTVKVQLGFTHQHRLSVLNLEFSHDATANDLLGRNAIYLFTESAHELDASS